MSRRGTSHFSHELGRLIDRMRQEYVMTGAEIVGVLEFHKARMINELLNVLTGEDEEEE